jgi:hypothetical protein
LSRPDQRGGKQVKAFIPGKGMELRIDQQSGEDRDGEAAQLEEGTGLSCWGVLVNRD